MSSSPESASHSQPVSSEKADSIENVLAAPKAHYQRIMLMTSVGVGDNESFGTWQCDDRTIKHETTPATQKNSEQTPNFGISGSNKGLSLYHQKHLVRLAVSLLQNE